MQNQSGVEYQLLEPLSLEEGSQSSVTISPDGKGFSQYFQEAYSFVLILIAIVAVFYLIYGGLIYITTDIANKQKQGKEIILRVITGLVFVFSSWLILNSINPAILNNAINFGQLSPTEANNQNNNPSNPPNTPAPPRITTCAEGFVSVYGITVCKTIETNLKNMIDAAKKDGVNLYGTGARSVERQIALRKKNCGPTYYDIYEKPSGQCKPPTAIPGTSMHEKGLAVDFKNIPQHTCTPTCQWLQRNAGTYGFKNDYAATKEYWHWSTTGR